MPDYYLKVKHSGKLLTALENGEIIVQWGIRPDSSQKQKWKCIEENGNCFFIIERDGQKLYLQKKKINILNYINGLEWIIKNGH